MNFFRRGVLGIMVLCGFGVASLAAATPAPTEEQVAAAVKSPGVTVVHLWAPWERHATAALAKNGWSLFLDTNAEVKFIFVTAWSADDGRELLAKNDVGRQANFQLLQHPNPARTAGERMDRFLGLPVTWLPTTWVFRDGQLRYALNHGEVRWPLLQQLIRDAADPFDR